MAKITKEQADDLMQRWLKEDQTLQLNELVSVLDKLVRKLVTEPNEDER